MTAFVPITPQKAVEIMGVAGAEQRLADYAAAGLVKSYAAWMETVGAGSVRDEVRDKAIPRDAWRRIIANDQLKDVWATGTVRLDGSANDGTASMTLVGIGFNEDHVRTAAHRLGIPAAAPPTQPPVSSPAPQPAMAVDVVVIERPEPELKPDQARRISPNALAVTVKEAAELLGVCESTIYNMVGRGELTARKLGRRTVIAMSGIRQVMGLTDVEK